MKKWMYIWMAALLITGSVAGCSGQSESQTETTAAGRRNFRKPDGGSPDHGGSEQFGPGDGKRRGDR